MSTKVVVAAVGAVAAVGVAIGWRASRSDRRGADDGDSTAREPLLFEDVDAERFVEGLTEAITYRTVVLDDGTYDAGAFDALGAMLARRYPRVHAELQRETFDGHGLLYTWVGTDPLLEPIVLMAHQDVVPVEEGTEEDWVASPFDGSVVDGKVYGRGALDCKGPLIAVFEAIEYLLERDVTPQRTVLVVSGHDEEIGGASGARVIAEELRMRDVTPWFVVDEGGAVADGLLPAVKAPIALVGIAEKGFMNVRLTARGEGGHSSMPPAGTAIAELAGAVARLEANPVPARTEPLTPTLRALSDHLPGVVGTLVSRPTLHGAAAVTGIRQEPSHGCAPAHHDGPHHRQRWCQGERRAPVSLGRHQRPCHPRRHDSDGRRPHRERRRPRHRGRGAS